MYPSYQPGYAYYGAPEPPVPAPIRVGAVLIGALVVATIAAAIVPGSSSAMLGALLGAWLGWRWTPPDS